MLLLCIPIGPLTCGPVIAPVVIYQNCPTNSKLCEGSICRQGRTFSLEVAHNLMEKLDMGIRKWLLLEGEKAMRRVKSDLGHREEQMQNTLFIHKVTLPKSLKGGKGLAC